MESPGKIKKILVIGAGAWGTTVANLLAEKGLHVSIWARESELTNSIQTKHVNPKYLPGFSFSGMLSDSLKVKYFPLSIVALIGSDA